ncbi:tyrosine-type recombinase/integrase [Bacillus sp. S70]|uniref:tyrosine-type recombinase/integrase n=1 Tax=Bacillus TaxID=1386 RepID=UPI00190BA20F|nr:tyrosine-type recombinase/integrase [Bacillus sp. S29]MBK0104120.1 tyrosine-type recombinase/integrase [Bacillus sp. S70]MBK0109565.1 tyrosine-type recombinase/integrase [Bacillus sp. S73]MBK0137028.1 tyrosine-type recombinase/integrase [Bacillus sp. S72]MBK0148874.1 tyrosine-type recombinase/integrase [Bacillus sp. S74]MBK0160007.1 tyrosine-type recombinase/integrase [Bacillus sp. S71]HDR4706065.1 tyrosine-type recombinase/integrase [Bacillus paranthracis]
MKVQKIKVDNKPYPLYILLNKEYQLVEPVMRFVKYLDNTGKSPNTIKTYCYHLKLYYEFMDQREISLNETSFEELANFVGWLRYPTVNKVIEIKLKDAVREETTVNAILNAVMSYIEYLNRMGEFRELNVFKEAKGRNFKSFLHHINKGKYQKNVLKLRAKKKQIQTLELDQVKQILDACRTTRDKLIIMLMYEGGLRIGEVLSLRLEDIVTWDNQICLTPRDVNENGAYIKLRKARTIHVSKELMTLYTEYLVYEYSEEIEHDYVFISLKKNFYGIPLKYQSVLDLIRRITKRTGIKFTPHVLRHTHATELIRNGWDVAYVQKRLGHANVQTTLNTYVHLSNQDMKNEFKKYLERKEGKL